MCLCRFTADVIACTTQPGRTARGVRTFTMTPPGGPEAETRLISAGVNEKKLSSVFGSIIVAQCEEGSHLE